MRDAPQLPSSFVACDFLTPDTVLPGTLYALSGGEVQIPVVSDPACSTECSPYKADNRPCPKPARAGVCLGRQSMPCCCGRPCLQVAS
jgi:hypothetical protein